MINYNLEQAEGLLTINHSNGAIQKDMVMSPSNLRNATRRPARCFESVKQSVYLIQGHPLGQSLRERFYAIYRDTYFKHHCGTTNLKSLSFE